MSETKNVQNEPIAQEELNLDAKVTVRNIAPWDVGFARKADGVGDIGIAPNGVIRLSRNEIIVQSQSGNKLFNGIDGRGSHATLYIDDAATRRELEFESANTKQESFVNVDIAKLFDSKKSQSAFEKEFMNKIRTRAEKCAVIEAMRKAKVSDYHKIRFAEDYTGFRF